MDLFSFEINDVMLCAFLSKWNLAMQNCVTIADGTERLQM